MFFRIAGVVGHDEWRDDPRCASQASRVAIAAEINAAVAAVLKTETTAYWLEKFEAADSLCAPVLDYAATLSHPQTLHAGFMRTVNQPGLGELPAASLPGMQTRKCSGRCRDRRAYAGSARRLWLRRSGDRCADRIRRGGPGVIERRLFSGSRSGGEFWHLDFRS